MTVTAQRRLSLTCIACKDLRNFEMDTGNADGPWATYACMECGHRVRLDLDPATGPD
jgi:uncharacterized protein YlaI